MERKITNKDIDKKFIYVADNINTQYFKQGVEVILIKIDETHMTHNYLCEGLGMYNKIGKWWVMAKNLQIKEEPIYYEIY